jgi:hypothetical protein
MKAARCLWTVGLICAAFAPRLAVGQSAPVGSTAMPITPTETTTAPASPWSWIKLPKITMPKIEMPKDPLAPVKVSARKVKDGTKKAWEGTKELFTFGSPAGEGPTARVASRQEPPSIWSRMFGRSEEQQPPQTVADFMAQPRPE